MEEQAVIIFGTATAYLKTLLRLRPELIVVITIDDDLSKSCYCVEIATHTQNLFSRSLNLQSVYSSVACAT